MTVASRPKNTIMIQQASLILLLALACTARYVFNALKDLVTVLSNSKDSLN